MNKRRLVVVVFVLALVLAVAAPVGAQGSPDDRVSRAEVRFMEGMIDHHQMALDMAADCLAKASTESVRGLCQGIIDTQSAEINVLRGYLLIWYGIEYRPMPMMGMMPMMSMMMGGGMQGGMMGGDMGMMQGGMMGGDTGMMQGGPMQGSQMPDEHHPDQAGQATPVPGMPQAAPMPGMPQGGMMGDMGMMQGGMINMMGGMMDPNNPPMMMGMMSGLYSLTGTEYEIAWLEAMIDHHDDAVNMSRRLLKVDIHPELAAIAQGIIDAQTAEIEQMEGMITELGGV